MEVLASSSEELPHHELADTHTAEFDARNTDTVSTRSGRITAHRLATTMGWTHHGGVSAGARAAHKYNAGDGDGNLGS